jgi:hypothetical protein
MPSFIAGEQIEQVALRKMHQRYDFELRNCHPAGWAFSPGCGWGLTSFPTPAESA